MEQSNGFKEVRDALEVATRIEAMRAYAYEQKRSKQHQIGALTTVEVNEVSEYARLERLGTILYKITRDLNDPKWTPARCYDEIQPELW